MANKIVKYKLDGGTTIPSWIEDGGYYPTSDEVMIGATVDGSDETGLGELADEAAVKTYLDSYTSDWKVTRADGTEEDFNQTTAAAGIWAKKID